MTTTMAAMLLLGAICWLFRILFIVVVPAERLPEGVRDGLGHLAPSVMAALVAVELVGMTSRSSPPASALVLVTALVVGALVRATGSLILAIGAAAAAVAVIDLLVLA
jgi:branched-subunit amino acid transport protein